MSAKLHWNYELIAAMAAVFIGACALVVSIVQTRVMLRQESASVWPIVHWGVSVHSDGTKGTGDFELYAENKGVGPAVVEQVRLNYQGKTYLEDSMQVITIDKMLIFEGQRSMQLTQATLEGSVLAANERKSLIKVDLGSGGDTLARQFLEAVYREDLNIIICYRDIYEHRWIVEAQNKVTEVRNCP